MRGGIKILVSWFLASQLFMLTAFAKPDWPSDMGIQAEAGIVMDVDSGAVLFGQNIHSPYPPASITKILTALIVLENGSLDDMVIFSDDAVNNVESDSGNKLNVEAGDQLSVEDCLYSLLLQSCNQAANALAEYVAGSQEEFVRMMNEKIAELGCTESHFDNPSGLNGDTQYVSAYDMALIARAAYSTPKLLEISSTVSRKLAPTVNNPSGLTVRNEHRLVKTDDPSSEFYYPPAVAGKTGWLLKAGNTLVTYAEQDGRRLVSVVLKGSPRQYFIDGKNLLEFGFSRFDNFSVKENEKDFADAEESPAEELPEGELSAGNPSDPGTVKIAGTSYNLDDLELGQAGMITLPKGAEVSDADKVLITELPAGSPEGAVAMLQYTYNDRVVGQEYLMLKEGVLPPGQEAETLTGDEENEGAGTSGMVTSPQGTKTDPSMPKGFGKTVVGIGSVLVLAGAGIGFFVYTKKKERRAIKARREERLRRLKQDGEEEAFRKMLEQRRKSREKLNK